MRAAYLAAGAAGMYCGSCLRDNRLAATLLEQGRDVVLCPLYTPLRTDERSVASRRVFFGGIGVYLRHALPWSGRFPRWLDWLWDRPGLLSALGRLATATDPARLGPLTLSILDGAAGPHTRAIDGLIEGLRTIRPDVINLPNLMFAAVAGPLRRALNVPVVCTLSGEDVFVDKLPERFRRQAFERIRAEAPHIDAFIATTKYFADHAAAHFGLPRDRVYTVPLGVRVDDFRPSDPPAEPFTIGYLARICPDKGLHVLAEAFIRLRQAGRDCRLRIAGHLGRADRRYLRGIDRRWRQAGVRSEVTLLGEVSRAKKLDLLARLHVLSVPTVYAEAKGLFVLEALAAGVPVVQPEHGSFPELIDATGGGLLVTPHDPGALVEGIARLMDDPPLRRRLGAQGRSAVRAEFTDVQMADRTWMVYKTVREAWRSGGALAGGSTTTGAGGGRRDDDDRARDGRGDADRRGG